MEDGSPVFGPVAYKLTLSEAIGRGIVAPYLVLCFDIRDPELYPPHETVNPYRYAYDLGGVRVGPEHSPVLIRPDWRGAPPPSGPLDIRSIRGCDVSPIDLADPAAALRLKAYVWAEMRERLDRLDALTRLAVARPPRIDRADAADWVEARLAEPHEEGVTRVLYHSIVWQYLPEDGRARITAAMERTGRAAPPDYPLAWLALETNRETFRHELTVRFWPGGEEPVVLGEAHAHGAWVEWRG